MDATGHGTMPNMLMGAAPGTYTITASYTGDSTYAGAPSVSQTVVVYDPGSSPPTSGPAIYSYSITQPDGSASGYEEVGNVTAYTDSVNGHWSAGYDTLNRLTSATQTPVGAAAQYFCWRYDSFGNRRLQALSNRPFGDTCSAQANASLTPTVVEVDGNNRVTSASGSPGYAYDASGNVTSDGIHDYLYECRRQDACVTAGGESGRRERNACSERQTPLQCDCYATLGLREARSVVA